MLDQEDKDWIESLLNERFENRLSTHERELNQNRRQMITVEDARQIFRTDTMRTNMWTRIAVAVIAALAVIGNGTSNVLVDHTESKAMARYAIETDRKLDTFRSEIMQQHRELISDVRTAVSERNTHLEALIVKAGNR